MIPVQIKNLFMKIVIADDSSLLRERIKNLLNSINTVSVVGEALNGVEALQLIREKEPDLAILDIRMPEMNGIEVLKKIRELKMKVKVCILTNYPYPQYKKKCIEAGADYFLSKAEDFEDIKIIISELVNSQKGG
jgi:DNA-binding NarL/FixJ family response regulator